MQITCEIIRDLLPLYHDNVCSGDSRKLVDEHLTSCSKCREELAQFDSEFEVKNNMDDVKTIKTIAQKWKKDRLSAFLMGVLLFSILACVGCIVSYNLIGSHLAADGTLVEPFALIPLFYIFALIGIISGIILGANIIVRRKRKLKSL